MAYGGPSQQKDNFGRFQKYATINLTKKMQQIAEITQNNLQEDIADKLLEVYTHNVELSYTPTGDGSYVHTGTFLENITTEIEKDKVKIVILNKKYEQPKERTTTQVYKFLTEGTKGGGDYAYFNKDGGHPPIKFAYNHPTPAHLFEQHTQIQMKGYLESIKTDIEKGKYSK